MQTVEAIIDGSHKIDEMRKRIDETVKMMYGLLNRRSRENLKLCRKIQFKSVSGLVWEIDSEGAIRFGLDEKISVKIIYDINEPSKLCFTDVQFVYEHLYLLIQGMMKEFLEIKDGVEVFANASKADL